MSLSKRERKLELLPCPCRQLILLLVKLIFLLVILTLTFSIDVAAAAGKGTLRHLAKPATKPAKPAKPAKPDKPDHPNRPKEHKPNNGCPKQEFPTVDGVTTCPNGGAFSEDTCIACCECECDGTTVVEDKAKCEFEGEKDAVTLKTCRDHEMHDYDGRGGDCVSTCTDVCDPL